MSQLRQIFQLRQTENVEMIDAKPAKAVPAQLQGFQQIIGLRVYQQQETARMVHICAGGQFC